MINKEDWEKVKERYRAWWAGELIDRPVMQVFAPRKGGKVLFSWDWWNLVHNLNNPEKSIREFEAHTQNIFFGAEAFPNFHINLGPGIMAAYMGAVPRVAEDTVWFETPTDWEDIFQNAKFNPEDKWWKITQELTSKAVTMSEDKYFVNITDLGGSLDIAASLRGTQNLLFDLIDCPERVEALAKRTNELWFRYYEALDGIVRQKLEGTSTWMGIWSLERWYPLQCDFSAMISPTMFEKFVAPYLEEQARWLGYSIYHLDGPKCVQHLEVLLDIPELSGIQWTPGDGNPDVGSPKWFPLYKRILQKGKRLVLLAMAPGDLERLFQELPPKGLLVSATCNSEPEARELLHRVKGPG